MAKFHQRSVCSCAHRSNLPPSPDSSKYVLPHTPRIGYHFYNEGDLLWAFIASAGDSIDQLFADRARLTTYDGSDLDHGFGDATPAAVAWGYFSSPDDSEEKDVDMDQVPVCLAVGACRERTPSYSAWHRLGAAVSG